MEEAAPWILRFTGSLPGNASPPDAVRTGAADRSVSSSGPSGEEDMEHEVVLEPRPRQDRGELTVSRERLADEAGQNIDIQG